MLWDNQDSLINNIHAWSYKTNTRNTLHNPKLSHIQEDFTEPEIHNCYKQISNKNMRSKEAYCMELLTWNDSCI